jgi:hypothetical protein
MVETTVPTTLPIFTLAPCADRQGISTLSQT